MQRLVYRTASVETNAYRAIRIASVSGIVTSAALGSIIADSAQWAGGGAHLAHVVNYGGATMALDLGQMIAMAQSVKPADALMSTPAALVVRVDQLPLFDGYTAAMQARGFLIAAFTAGEAARRWAAQQALVREHWNARRAVLRLSAP
jgi:hypothetical protein